MEGNGLNVVHGMSWSISRDRNPLLTSKKQMQLYSSIEKCTQGNFLSKIMHCNAKIQKNECEWEKSTMGVCIFMASVTESLKHMGSSGKWRCVKNPGVSPVVDPSSTILFVLSVLEGAVLLISTIKGIFRPRRLKHEFCKLPGGLPQEYRTLPEHILRMSFSLCRRC